MESVYGELPSENHIYISFCLPSPRIQPVLLRCCRHSPCAHFLSNLEALGADIFCEAQPLFMALLDEVA